MGAVTNGVEIYLPLAGMVDLAEEANRLEKELANAKQELQRAQKKLDNQGFVTKAPAEIVQKEREKLALMTDTVKS